MTIVLLLYFGYKAVAMVVVQTVFNIMTLLLNYFFCKYKIHIKIRYGKFNWPFIKEISVYSFWIFLNAIMDKIYWGTGQFVLGAVSGTVAVAVFSVAILLENMYMTFSTSISSVLLPKVTSMVAHDKSDREISDLFIRTGRIQCIVMAFVLSGFIIFGQPFINLWAGNGYHDSYLITVIFFATLFIPLIQNTGIVILQARNQMKFRSLLYCAISLASLAFQIILAKKYGAIGCAIAIGGALILGQVIIMNIYYRANQRIAIGCFWREIGKMLITPILITAISIYTLTYVEMNDFISLSTGIILFTIIYTPIFWKFGMNNSERELLSVPFKRLIKR